MAELDALHYLRIHEGLAEADQHHVLGRIAGLADQGFEDAIRHVGLGLPVGFARAHGAVEIALGGGLDDILHRQRRQLGPARHVCPQQFCAVPGPHVDLIVSVDGGNNLISVEEQRTGRELLA